MQAQWPPAADAEFPRATFAMGCFWGPQLVFERVPGVVTTAVGYTDGQVENPSYNAVRPPPPPPPPFSFRRICRKPHSSLPLASNFG